MGFHVFYELFHSSLLMAVSLVQQSTFAFFQKHFLELVAERQRGRRAAIFIDDTAPICPSSQRSNILEKQSLPRIP